MFDVAACREFMERPYRVTFPDRATREVWGYYRIQGLRDDAFLALVEEGLEPGARILEVGSGTGECGIALAQRGFDVVTSDVSRSRYGGLQSLRVLSDGLLPRMPEFVAASYECLPFRAGDFDAVLCRDTLHHAFGLESVLAEIHRVLRPGGRVIAREPLRGSLVPERYALGAYADDPTNENAYTLRRWRTRFESAGLVVRSIEPLLAFHRWWGALERSPDGRRRFSYVSAHVVAQKPGAPGSRSERAGRE